MKYSKGVINEALIYTLNSPTNSNHMANMGYKKTFWHYMDYFQKKYEDSFKPTPAREDRVETPS